MYYSAGNNAWYATEFMEMYLNSGSWPDDAIEYPDSVYHDTVSNRSSAFIMVPDENGHPSLIAAPDIVPGVPRSVSMRQAQLALFSAGLLNQVDSFIESLPEPDRTQAWIEWNKSSEMHRDRPLVQNIGMALGLSEAQIDDLFIAAAGIE